MTDDKLCTSVSANTIMAILTNHVQRTRLITSSTDKHYSLDSEELHSPGRSHYTNYWYSWVQTIYYYTSCPSVLLLSVSRRNVSKRESSVIFVSTKERKHESNDTFLFCYARCARSCYILKAGFAFGFTPSSLKLLKCNKQWWNRVLQSSPIKLWR